MRPKGAYPSAQYPDYDEATRKWAMHILNDLNAAIRPLLDTHVARTLLENKDVRQPGMVLVSLFERIIQMNEWLEKYQVTLVL